MSNQQKVKVLVQVPCLNEEGTLESVLKSIPKHIPNVDIKLLVIDDGSKDRTVEIANQCGVHHIIRHARNQGLGRSFHDGAQLALHLGVDILVNTDGDNQYPQDRIPDLIQPIIDGNADMVIADRQTATIQHFSYGKKLLQKWGSHVVNNAAGTNVPDAASGFRAYSREALIQLNTITRFSYTMETIIQAGNKRLAITSVPVKTNAKTRESRLFRSTHEHVYKSALAIIRAYLMYKPYVLFVNAGILFLLLGLVPFVRFLFFVTHPNGAHHLQSLIAGSVLLTISLISFALAIIADLVRINRVLLENQLEISKRHYTNFD
ncbi:MAG TPA: glycosyltransferase family 2 protein [Candidatus Saccharimonadales bacterium]|nr:glycosyltransferase family 2 protein [Candidatus Saccharimonadales bacterium]